MTLQVLLSKSCRRRPRIPFTAGGKQHRILEVVCICVWKIAMLFSLLLVLLLCVQALSHDLPVVTMEVIVCLLGHNDADPYVWLRSTRIG